MLRRLLARMRCRCGALHELNGNAAEAYARKHLEELAVDPVNWTVRYRCPATGRQWLRDSPQSGLHGGGPPRLRQLDAAGELMGTPDSATRPPEPPAPQHPGASQVTMDVESLERILDSEGIDPAAYSLHGGMPPETYVLEPQPGRWIVFYSERGVRTDETVFESEADACSHLLELLLRDDTTRRRP